MPSSDGLRRIDAVVARHAKCCFWCQSGRKLPLNLSRSIVLMAKYVSSLCFVAMLVVSAVAIGQDAMLEDLYGRGVHAFFAGNSRDAFDSLNNAIKSGSRDPRAFYYRGLLLNRFGRPSEAADDFSQDAELEMLGGEPYPVGRSLERVQGPERVTLERERR